MIPILVNRKIQECCCWTCKMRSWTARDREETRCCKNVLRGFSFLFWTYSFLRLRFRFYRNDFNNFKWFHFNRLSTNTVIHHVDCKSSWQICRIRAMPNTPSRPSRGQLLREIEHLVPFLLSFWLIDLLPFFDLFFILVFQTSIFCFCWWLSLIF